MLRSAVIEENKFKHSPRVGAVNRKASSLWSFVVSLKRISSTSDFKHIFSWFTKCIQPQVRGRQPQATKLSCQQNPFVISVICYKFQKNLFEVWFYTIFFHDFIHVYSPRAGTDNPLGTKFWCQQEHLVTSVICCKFQKNLFEVWFYTNFFMILYMYIATGQGQTASRGQNFDVNRNVLSLHSFEYKFQKNVFEVWFYTIFFKI